MTYSLELEAEQIRISYRENDLLLRRSAVEIAALLEKEPALRAACVGRRILLEFDRQILPGAFRISSKGNLICLSAADYLGLDSAVRKLFRSIQEGCSWRNGESRTGHCGDAPDDLCVSLTYAFRRLGNVRLMSYNVLWGHPNVCERNLLQAAAVDVYRPDVLGLQECADNNRVYAGDQNIMTLLEALGYRECTNPRIAGTYRRCNVSPILYNTATTELLHAESVIFRHQQEHGETRLLTWAVLSEKQTHLCYAVLNTQLEGGNAVIGLGQVKEIEELLDMLHTGYPEAPIFLIGDFNFIKTSNSYGYLTGQAGCVYVGDLATVYASPVKSYHPYPRFDPVLGLMQPDGGAERDADAVESFDRIFLARGKAEVAVFGVAVDACTLSASDHFPLFADVRISKSNS